MTTMPVASSAPPVEAGERLIVYLGMIHAEWLLEMRGVLDAAQRPGAGTWIRWSAIHYVDTVFSARFEQEREVVERLRLEVGAGHAGGPWVGAEFLAILRWQLDHLVGVCPRAEEFSTMTLKLLSAIDHWCHEVEDALGQLTWDDLSDEARRLLASLAGEAVPQGA